jgi:hypothetical protein
VSGEDVLPIRRLVCSIFDLACCAHRRIMA